MSAASKRTKKTSDEPAPEPASETSTAAVVAPGTQSNPPEEPIRIDKDLRTLPDSDLMREDELRRKIHALQILADEAQLGGTQALDELRKEIDRKTYLYTYLADTNRVIERWVCDLANGEDLLRREAFFRRNAELRSGLSQPDDHLIVKLTGSRIVNCWIFCQLLEIRKLAAPENDALGKWLEACERRLESAVRAYKLAVQVNQILQDQAAQPVFKAWRNGKCSQWPVATERNTIGRSRPAWGVGITAHRPPLSSSPPPTNSSTKRQRVSESSEAA